MFPRGQHPIYSCTPEMRRNILEDVGIKETEMEEYVNILTEWYHKEPHLPEGGINPNMIEVYVVAYKGSVEKIKKSIDAFYRLRLIYPELFSDRIKLLKTSHTSVCNAHTYAPISKLYNGKRVTVIKINDPDNIRLDDLLITTYMNTSESQDLMMGINGKKSRLVDVRQCNDFMTGDIWIIDVENMTLANFLNLKLTLLHKAALTMHEGIRIKVFDIHIINCSLASLAQTMLSMLKPLLSKKIFDRIKLHKGFEDLHEYVPYEYLPKDYGGEGPTLEEYKDIMVNFLNRNDTKEFLIEGCKWVSDESKRPRTEYNEDCLPGTFKKLDID